MRGEPGTFFSPETPEKARSTALSAEPLLRKQCNVVRKAPSPGSGTWTQGEILSIVRTERSEVKRISSSTADFSFLEIGQRGLLVNQLVSFSSPAI